jgi:hypothetical protein
MTLPRTACDLRYSKALIVPISSLTSKLFLMTSDLDGAKALLRSDVLRRSTKGAFIVLPRSDPIKKSWSS